MIIFVFFKGKRYQKKNKFCSHTHSNQFIEIFDEKLSAVRTKTGSDVTLDKDKGKIVSRTQKKSDHLKKNYATIKKIVIDNGHYIK